jgi:hypothetical protein
MAEYQLGLTLTDDETGKIVAFLRTLTGDNLQSFSRFCRLQLQPLLNQTGIDFWLLEKTLFRQDYRINLLCTIVHTFLTSAFCKHLAEMAALPNPPNI